MSFKEGAGPESEYNYLVPSSMHDYSTYTPKWQKERADSIVKQQKQMSLRGEPAERQSRFDYTPTGRIEVHRMPAPASSGGPEKLLPGSLPRGRRTQVPTSNVGIGPPRDAQERSRQRISELEREKAAMGERLVQMQ